MKSNGWTASNEPDPGAEANVFFPYCQWRYSRFRKTVIAAWMTHLEDESVEHGAKRKRWFDTAPVLDLRVTPSRMYYDLLRHYGPTVLIPHPVELDKFVIVKPKTHPKPIIGVAGRVYSGGRKGESLVRRLYEEQGNCWEVRAAGRGWPVPTSKYAWSRLQEFYQSLDVFLCTSLVEGGPVTVLEALACGKRVVIPWHVGAMDEIPEYSGARHYEAGNYASMVDAIKLALDDETRPKAMRAIAGEYTVDRWCRRWREAMEEIVG